MNSTIESQLTANNLTSLVLDHFLNYIDFGFRGLNFFIHLTYFSYLALKKNSELRSRTCLFMHNVNLSTMLIGVVYTSFIPFSVPSFSNPTANTILCRLTEIFWMWIKYGRTFSLLYLALYRYIGCFKIRLYNEINSKLFNIYGLIFSCWFFSFIIPMCFKLGLGTSYSIYWCTDGFAPDNLTNSVVYYVANTTLSSITPTVAIFIIYFKIYQKLKEQSIKTGISKTRLHRVGKYAKQFIIINVITSLATVFSTFIDFVCVIAAYPELNHFQEQFKFVRPAFRIVMLLLQSLVPIVSIYYTCWSWSNFKSWFFKHSSAVRNDKSTQSNNNILYIL